MAVVCIPHHEPWVMSGWAHRMLLGRARDMTVIAEDRHKLTQAEALSGLHFDLLDPAQAKRLARLLEKAAGELRAELLNDPRSEPMDLEFADKLGEIELCLVDVYDK